MYELEKVKVICILLVSDVSFRPSGYCSVSLEPVRVDVRDAAPRGRHQLEDNELLGVDVVQHLLLKYHYR